MLGVTIRQSGATLWYKQDASQPLSFIRRIFLRTLSGIPTIAMSNLFNIPSLRGLAV